MLIQLMCIFLHPSQHGYDSGLHAFYSIKSI